MGVCLTVNGAVFILLILTNLMLLTMLILKKEDKEMIAMLWVFRIVAEKETYADVPRLLKPQVKELLIEAGLEEFITEDE